MQDMNSLEVFGMPSAETPIETCPIGTIVRWSEDYYIVTRLGDVMAVNIETGSYLARGVNVTRVPKGVQIHLTVG